MRESVVALQASVRRYLAVRAAVVEIQRRLQLASSHKKYTGFMASIQRAQARCHGTVTRMTQVCLQHECVCMSLVHV